MQDPVKRLEEKFDRLVAEGKMTPRKQELMERRLRQLTGRTGFMDKEGKMYRIYNPKLHKRLRDENGQVKVVARNKYGPAPEGCEARTQDNQP